MDVVTEPRVARDLAPLDVDRRQLIQAHLVDVARLQVERGPLADRVPVERLAVGRRDQARLLARRGKVLIAENVEVALVRGVDDVADHLADALTILLGCHLAERGHHGPVERCGEGALDLADGPLCNDPRRRATGRDALAQDLDVLVHERGIRTEPREPQLEALRGVGLLEHGDLGEQGLGAIDLVHGPDLVEPQVVALGDEAGRHLDHVGGDPVLHRELVRQARRRIRQPPPPAALAVPPSPRGPGRRGDRRTAGLRRRSRSWATVAGSPPTCGLRSRRSWRRARSRGFTG